MRLNQYRFTDWETSIPRDSEAQFVLVFGCRHLLSDSRAFPLLREAFPHAVVAGCSTAGEIGGVTVSDNEVVLTSICFNSTSIQYHTVADVTPESSFTIGSELTQALVKPDLSHVFVFSDGLLVNGSELVAGLREQLPLGVNVTGGLAADGAVFEQTVVMANGPARSGQVIAIGLYGRQLQIGCGSLGGWDSFGPDRLITRAQKNILYELDGEPALDLYKKYLGSLADELPSSGLLFPLAVEMPGSTERVVRTILAIDENQKSLIFAGDLPEGSYAQLMKANFNRLIDGAMGAAEISHASFQKRPPQLALLISCVGRKLVLKQRIEEEVEGVRDVLGKDVMLAGFYSYGEIAPHGELMSCTLHNQTMTITLLSELE